MDNDKNVDDFDSYLYNLDLSEFNYTGLEPFISGRKSGAGNINDPWSLSGTMKLTANLKAWTHFDPKTCTPQIVLYAL